MPTIIFRSSVTAFSSTTALLFARCASGTYSSVFPRHSTAPFRWYMPFTSFTSRVFTRRFRVCSAGNPREEKFTPALISASLHP